MKLSRPRRLLHLSRILATFGFTISFAAPTPSDAAEIKVLTSRAMNYVLTELGGAFEHASGHKVTLILAPPTEIMKRLADPKPSVNLPETRRAVQRKLTFKHPGRDLPSVLGDLTLDGSLGLLAAGSTPLSFRLLVAR